MVDVRRSLVKLTLGSAFLLTALACPDQIMATGALLLNEDSLKLLMTADFWGVSRECGKCDRPTHIFI